VSGRRALALRSFPTYSSICIYVITVSIPVASSTPPVSCWIQEVEAEGCHVEARPGHVEVQCPSAGEQTTTGHKERHGLGKILTPFDKLEEARSKQVGGGL
jgi:hypothetical protein